jgi:hypothetical protein
MYNAAGVYNYSSVCTKEYQLELQFAFMMAVIGFINTRSDFA